jgi:hypothetical protein
MTDYNLIDRITAIKLELEYETNNSYSIIIAIRNILHQSDGLSYPEIRDILITYFNLNPDPTINNNIINLITGPNTATSNSHMMLLLNHLNPNNQFTNNEVITSQAPLDLNIQSINNELLSDAESDIISDTDSDYDTDSILTDSDEDIPESEDNPNQIPTFEYPNNNMYSQYLNHIFYGSGNIQFTNYESDISNQINSLLTLSNMINVNVNDYSQDNNIFTQIFNMNNNNTYSNDDIPIVITEESFNKLKKCKYKDVNTDIKKLNSKCMITLDEFNDDDDIIILPCGHVFMLDEITSWLRENSYKCPTCRNPCGNYYAKIN